MAEPNAQHDGTVTNLSRYRGLRDHGGRPYGTAETALVLPEGPAAPPTGTVTFLLTDIEGSTPQWEARPDAMAAAVARHYEILDAAVLGHGGVRPIEQGEGDSMVATFARASDAVGAALAAQRVLTAEAWPSGAEVSVRMALHTGEARLRDGLYYVGPSIIRCARLRALGHGGQVLLSAATGDLLVGGLPAESGLLPLGAHRLKGLREPERVFQLTHPHLPSRFPPLHSVDTLTATLPVTLTSFVGREAELAELGDLIARHRMLTLAGAGGTGKTRLAAQAATEAAEDHPDGVWWAELASVRDAALVPRAVMHAVGLEDAQGMDPIARVTGFLGTRRFLLVLDNCEHLTAAAAAVAASVLAGCPHATVLATSREPLGVAGEVVWRVPPLQETAAVRLFAERAAEARPGFAVDGSNAEAVAELCTRLDGMPLAIELAAARIRALTPQRILDGLSRRFALLTGGARSSLPHQQTLAASMAWSHDLLTEDQQVLLRRLSVFVGRFRLEDVEAVVAAPPLSGWDCLVLLADLVDRSLVIFDGEHYTLLQTVREFAAERVKEAGEESAIRAAHLTHFAAVAATAGAELEDGPQAPTLERLAVARDDLLAAISFARATGEWKVAARFASDLAVFWQMYGRFTESNACLREVLTMVPDDPSAERARLLWTVAQASIWSMDRQSMYGIAEAAAAVELAASLGADDVLGRALAIQCFIGIFAQPEAAIGGLHQGYDAAQRAGDRWGAAEAAKYLCFGYTYGLDRPDLAGPWLDRLAEAAQETGSPYWAAWRDLLRGIGAWRAGRLREAADALAPVIDVGWALHDPMFESWGATFLLEALVDLGEAERAAEIAARSTSWHDRSCYGRAEWVRSRLPRLALDRGDLAAAQEGLARFAALKDAGFPFVVVEVALLSGRVALARGEPAAALAGAENAGAGADSIASAWYGAAAANLAGQARRAAGNHSAAEDAHHRALETCVDHGFAAVAAETLDRLAGLAAAAGSWAESARLYGAGDALRLRTGRVRPAVDVPGADADAAAAIAALGRDAYERAYVEGGSLTLAEAASYARTARADRKRPSSGWDSLTPAEARVVVLVAEGLSNAEIGERLHVGTGTVRFHLRNVFGKLGVSRRSELATRATERRLADDA